MENFMNLWLVSFALFLAGYLVNMLYITVFYHRGLTHGAVLLKPRVKKFVAITGSWITGIDPKAWACMHRLHHLHSDTELDPHSPWNRGIWGVMIDQLRAYEKVLVGLKRKNPAYTEMVKDLDFPMSWSNRKKVWLLPYLLHLAIGIVLALTFHAWFIGAAYWLGITSHPFQGFIVNSFSHRFGYRNHATADQSRNNSIVAWLTMGEGYQNNHHAHPASPKFSERWYEFDAGYALVLLARYLRIIKPITQPSTPNQNLRHPLNSKLG
jgi:stearoyl-CoA desaturase (delta-9 desaturase)